MIRHLGKMGAAAASFPARRQSALLLLFALLLLILAPLAARSAAQSVLYTLPGAAPNQMFGTAVAPAGDVDADGFPDFIVGAAGDDTAGVNAGAAFVYSGRTGALLWSWLGEQPGEELGDDVAGVGDVNGDGHDDVLVGAYRHDGVGLNSGRARVFSGADGSELLVLDGTGVDDEFGIGVAGVGDLDGDGRPDVAVGAHHDDDNGFNSGSVRVVSGATGSQLFLFLGDEMHDDLGHVLAGLGDIDGDAVPDVLVGLHDTPDPGQARVFSGADGAVLYNFTGSTNDDFYGHAVAGPGDVDGDGVPDLLIGASLDDTTGSNAGRAWLHSGADGSIVFDWDGDAPDDGFGASVSGAGDWNGDGVRDVVVGIPGADPAGPGSSAARFFSGVDGSALFTYEGTSPGLRFDIRVAALGDVNGDGRPDVALGLSYHDLAGTDAGLVQVISGALPVWTDLGGGLAGGAGVPALKGAGALVAGSAGALKLSGAAPSSPALLLVSAASTPTPFKCGTLVAVPILFQLMLPTSPAGQLPLAWGAWPGGLSGASLYFQLAVGDAGAPCGASISNALRADVP